MQKIKYIYVPMVKGKNLSILLWKVKSIMYLYNLPWHKYYIELIVQNVN